MSHDAKNFDKRTLRHHQDRGVMTKAEIDGHLGELEDVSELGEETGTRMERTRSEDEAAEG
jgi:hypothetical protein